MSDWRLATPVVFIIFNRPDTTARVFAEIARARPPMLLVVADGPRRDRPGEADRCAATRAIIDQVDWPCQVLTEYSGTNLGCRNRVASGIDWAFSQVEEAIFLEDDCLPDPSFFRYCEELLQRYRHDERIAMISGDNFQFGRVRTAASYYFSRYAHIWGWASWARAWRHYSRDAASWPAMRDGNWLAGLVLSAREQQYWSGIFQAVHEGRIDTWDYQWMLAMWTQGMLNVVPRVNLISNIGFGAEATHTREVGVHANMPIEAIRFPLSHPDIMLPDRAADRFVADSMFSAPDRRAWRRRLRTVRRLVAEGWRRAVKP